MQYAGNAGIFYDLLAYKTGYNDVSETYVTELQWPGLVAL